jgi:Leucine-rich repeat (LRR) protein
MPPSSVCPHCGRKMTNSSSAPSLALCCPKCDRPAKPPAALRSPALIFLSMGLVLFVAAGAILFALRHRTAPPAAPPAVEAPPAPAEVVKASIKDVINPVIFVPPVKPDNIGPQKSVPVPAALTLEQELERLAAEPRMLAEVNLAGVDFTVQVPQGAQVAKTLKSVLIKKDSAFELNIEVGAADLAFVKDRWESDKTDRLNSLLRDSEDTLLGAGVRIIDGQKKPSYRFVRNVRLDQLTVHVRNSVSTDALQPFGRSDCLRMLACAESLAWKKSSPPPNTAKELEEFGIALERDQGGRILGMTLAAAPCSDDVLAQLPLARLAPTLKRLDLSGAILSDKGLKPLAVLKNLRTLILPESTVTPIRGFGLADLASLTQLQELTLANSAVNDDGLANMKVFPALKSLNLTAAPLTGTGFEHLKGPTRLQVLHLEGTPVNDAGLRCLGHLTGLRQLYLQGSKITDAGLEHLNRLTSLTALHLDDTAIDGGGFASLSGLTDMEILKISRSRFSDIGLKHLAAMRKLTTLELASTAVTGEGFPALAKMNRLKFLFLRQAPVNDAGLAHFPPLPALQVLDLSGTQVTDTGVQALKRLTNLRNLMLQDTAITGSGLEGLRASTQLASLSLRRTRLQNDALAYLRPFKKLTALSLAETAVGDPGLAYVKELNKLETLDLTGTATTDAGLEYLADLKTLRLVQALRSKVTTEGANRFKKNRPALFLDVAD